MSLDDDTQNMLEDNNTTGYIKRPAKSILKQKENNTMPLSLPSLRDGALKAANRRVSFANKVKLHKIDFVPVSEENDAHTNVTEQLDESSDSMDEDSSFLNLEADADKVVAALQSAEDGILGHTYDLSDDENDEPDAEQTMELTDQVRLAVQNNGLEDPQLSIPEDAQEEVDMELTQTVKTVTEEVTMNFTMIQTYRQPTEPPKEAESKAEIPQETETQTLGDAPNEQDAPVGELASGPESETPLEPVQATNSTPPPEHNEANTNNDNITKEADAELSKYPEELLSPIQVPALSSIADELDEESEEEVQMELTQSLSGTNSTVPEVQDNKEPEKSSTNAQRENLQPPPELDDELSSPSDEEDDMELSTPIFDTIPTLKGQNPRSSFLHKLDSHEEDSSAVKQTDATSQNGEEPQSEETPKEINSPVKRTLEAAIEFTSSKRHALEEQVSTTTTIPLADTSTGSWNGYDDNDVKLSLTEFLNEIGVRFYDDLEIATELSNRYQIPLKDGDGDYAKEDYYRANIQLPLLEVYELSCKELAGKIQQGDLLFEELKNKTLEDNPELFREYLSASFYDQMTMKSRFHLLKEYTRQQAKEVWYEWRTKLIKNILETLQTNVEILRNDQLILNENCEMLQISYQKLKLELQSVRLSISRFKEIRSSFQDLDVEQIKNIKHRLTDLNHKLTEHKSLIHEKEQKMNSLQTQLDMRNAQIAELLKRVSEEESKLNKIRHFNSNEIQSLQLESDLLQACAGLKFIKKTEEGKFEFEFDPRMKISIDISKADSADGLVFHPLKSQDTVLYNGDLLTNYCHKLAQETAFVNIYDTLAGFRKQWVKFLEVDKEIYRLSLRYPLKFRTSTEDAIVFDFQYFCFKENVKADFTVEIPLKTIADFPRNAAIYAKVLRGKTMSLEQLRRYVAQGDVPYPLILLGKIELATQ